MQVEIVIISAALQDTLVKVDRATGEQLLPNLATDWEWVDGTHCRFTLRDDVTMSDGTPLVAEDKERSEQEAPEGQRTFRCFCFKKPENQLS
jgi:MarR-like DNA-binding transcriptional regulator SgrR of sgrS sRNA